MVRINAELMRQRRIQLGWTSEQLAAECGLDARTIRRMEQGKTRARLHTAVAVAEALTVDTSAFVLDERPAFLSDERSSAGEQVADEDRVASAFKAAESTFQTDLTCAGDQNLKEMMYVSSLLLTRALAMEGKEPAEKKNAGVHDVVAAFKAADVAIRTTLSDGGALSIEDATCVLSLLFTRYGIAFSRQSRSGPMTGYTMIAAVSDRTRKALEDYLTPGDPALGVTTSDDLMSDWISVMSKGLRQEEFDELVGGEEWRPGWPTEALRPERTVTLVKKSDKDASEAKVAKSRDKP